MAARKSFVETGTPEQARNNERIVSGKNIFIFCLVLIFIWAMYMAVIDGGLSGKVEPTTVRNIFIDVDGDGSLDFVTYIEYVPNSTSSIVFPDGQ